MGGADCSSRAASPGRCCSCWPAGWPAVGGEDAETWGRESPSGSARSSKRAGLISLRLVLSGPARPVSCSACGKKLISWINLGREVLLTNQRFVADVSRTRPGRCLRSVGADPVLRRPRWETVTSGDLAGKTTFGGFRPQNRSYPKIPTNKGMIAPSYNSRDTSEGASIPAAEQPPPLRSLAC